MTDRETIVVDCNSQYGRCSAVNKLQEQLQRAEQKLKKIKQCLEENKWCILDVISKELLQIIEE